MLKSLELMKWIFAAGVAKQNSTTPVKFCRHLLSWESLDEREKNWSEAPGYSATSCLI